MLEKATVLTTIYTIDIFRNKEGSKMATASRHRLWLVLVAGSHADA